MLEFLNQNSGAFSVVFAFLVTLATIAYAVLTYTLVRETRLLRQVQTEPKIEITARSFDFAITMVRLRIRNSGLGPAYNLQFRPKILKGGDSASKLLQEFMEPNYFKVGLSYIGSGHEHFSGVTSMPEDYDGKIASIISFDIDYMSGTGQKYQETIIIDMSEQKGTYQVGKPNLYSIAKSLESLKQDIGHIASGFKRIKAEVYTAKDRELERKQLQEMHERRKGAKTENQQADS